MSPEGAQEGSGWVDPKEGLFEHGDFIGLRNNVPPEGMDLGDLVMATNVDINDALEVTRRKGFAAPLTTAIDRCLWSNGSICLGVGTNALKIMNPNGSVVTLKSGLTPGVPVDYADVADRVYWSNGVDFGCVQGGQNRSWGLPVPVPPIVTAGPGSLQAGMYQVAVTNIRNDGQESGAELGATCTLAATGGLQLTNIPVSPDPTIVAQAVYATSVNGETLYRVGVIANTSTTFLVANIQKDSMPLETQFLQPPPAGSHLAYWKGWMLVATDRHLYPSEEYGPELFDIRKAIPFNSRITMLAPLNNRTDGIYVGTDTQVLWLDGDSPETLEYKTVAEYGVIPGTLDYIDSELLGDNPKAGDTIAVFATTRGICVGNVGGVFQNLTEPRYAYPVMDVGAGITRRHRGTVQYVVTLQGTPVPGNVAT